MKPTLALKVAPTVLWFALIASAQTEPPPAEPPPAAATAASPAPAPPKPPPAPKLHCSTQEILPETVLDIDFPLPVVPADQVNKEHDLITTSPAIPGKGTWTSRTTARYTFTSPPPLGTAITLSLRDGAKYEDGTAIPAGPLGTWRTPDFRLVSWPAGGGTEREPVTVLVFNDAIAAEKAAPFVLYVDGSGSRAPAKTGPLFYKDVPERLRWSLGMEENAAPVAWSDRWLAKTGPLPAPRPEDAVPFALVVRPHSPLQPSEKWEIELLAGLPNASGTQGLKQALKAGWFRVAPLVIQGLGYAPGPKEALTLKVNFSRSIPEKDVDWSQWITVSPPVTGLKITRSNDSQLTLESPDFRYRSQWSVTLKSGAPSASGVTSGPTLTKSVTPVPDEPDLSLPSWDTAQLAAGTRTYRIHTKNLKNAHVRVKLLTGDDATRTLRGYASMMGKHVSRIGRPKAQDKAADGALPWSLVPGRTVLDKTWEFEGRLDVSYPIVLNWSELLGGAKTPGVLFLSAEGEPLAAAVDQKNEEKSRVAQAVVQLTDIGLAWKLNHEEALIYAFSLETGAALANTALTLQGSRDPRTFNTDAQGLARVPRSQESALLTASRGGDQFTIGFDRTLPRESLWRFPVNVDWDPARDFRRQVMMFTDRGLYRPGETVHLKGIVRKRFDTDLRMADEREAQFSVLDSDQRPVLEKKVTFTDNGTFSETVTLPPSTVGQFTMRLEFPQPAKKDEAARGENTERQGEFDGEYVYGEQKDEFIFEESFRVEEFRRNSFEIQLDAPVCPSGTEKTEVPLSANYLMGQHLSDARVRYYAGAESVGFYPAQYRDFLFGDHDGYDRYYWNYYYGWEDGRDEDDEIVRSSDSQSGELEIGKDGRASVPVVIPRPEFPSSHRVSVSVEVTDVNQQTLSESTAFTVHASDTQIGISRPEEIVRTGRELPLKLLALGTDEKPLTRPLPVHVKVEHEVYETVKVENDSGVSQTRSEPRRTVVKETDVTLAPGAAPLVWPFTPDKAGTYLIELRAADEAGRQTATRTRFYCYGAGDYAWEYEQGARIRLVPEKKSWKPGETARVLVMTPVDGTALVTLERAGVVRAFTTQLSPDKPVLDIPLTDADSPNVYVSVAVIKGLAENKREVKEPILKLGYCQLVVENTKDALAVYVTVPRASYRPGAKAEVSGEVKTNDGQPAAGAEVTLWAVDEGVLSVMGYANPDPQSEFMPLLPLSVRCGTSLQLYLPEDVKQRWYTNKGFLIGDSKGGDDAGLSGKLRKDFNPLAFWQADLVTDAQGRYTAGFTVPDTLTRYRVLALAVKGARGFGLGTGALTVNKPLMIEPAVPRFASVGDVLVPKAVVHNTSPWNGTFAVTLEIGAEAQFAGSDKERSSILQQVELAAGETKALTWTVNFAQFGDTAWRWRAEPIKLPDNCAAADRADMVDFVESRFPVTYPGPLLSEQKLVVLTPDKPEANLLDGFSEVLTKRTTRVEVELSRSRFLECAEAMDYLLHYPYGCVEQTSSSTMPWLAAKELKGLLPKLKRSDSEIARAIQAGADRLLSMRTDSGGLAYWPGENNPNLWGSCWGGLTLLRCRDHGASVPDAAVEGLTKYLSTELRQLFASGTPSDYQHAAAALCTLAWAGKAEPAWHSKLFDQRATLSRGARAWLALAIMKSGGLKEQSVELLTNRPLNQADPHQWQSHGEYAEALELFAWCHVAPENPATAAAMDTLAGKRGPKGHWYTTFNNAWGLNAVAAWVTKVEPLPQDPALTLSGLWDGAFKLTKEEPARFFDLKPKTSQPAALLTRLDAAAGPTRLYANVKLTGQPELLPMRPVESGLSITRTYERLAADGKSEALGEPHVGDLVLVKLALNVPANVHYIAVDDPLPCTFEAVNSDFASQAAASVNANAKTQPNWREWVSSNEELRDDRALFFCDYVYGPNHYEIRYLARVTGVGEATAPQAKIEAMYEPEKYGLSASERVKTLPRAKGAEVSSSQTGSGRSVAER